MADQVRALPDGRDFQALAKWAEQATADQQTDVLWAAFLAIRGPKPPRVHGGSEALDRYLDLSNPFYLMLEANAYESAAMTLVPEGFEGLPLSFKVEKFFLGNGVWECRASVWCGLTGISEAATGAATPALALLAAALRAQPPVGES